MQSEKYIQALVEQTRQIINQAEKLKSHSIEFLNWRTNADSWTILECLEHMNLYGDFYLPQMESKIKSSATVADREFKSGFLGNYFAQSMLPKQKLNKMKTFKDKNPIHSQLDRKTIDRFIQQQIKLLDLLNRSTNISLNKIKVTTSISTLIRINLGDTFQFLINHMIRHMKQIENVEKQAISSIQPSVSF